MIMISSIKAITKRVIPGKYQAQLKKVSDIFYGYRWVMYLGSKYECPFCQKRFRAFLPMELDILDARKYRIQGHGYRDHCYCPRCFSLDRERLLYLYLLKRTPIFRDKISLLHVAPEKNLQRILMGQSNIKYLSADLLMDSVMVKMDISNIEYNDDSFDIIICNHVLQYVKDDSKAFSELFRVVKPGGWAILQVPLSSSLVNTYVFPSEMHIRDLDQAAYVRLYGQDYQEILECVGFRVEKFKWTDNKEEFGGNKNRHGLIEGEILHIAHKPTTPSIL